MRNRLIITTAVAVVFLLVVTVPYFGQAPAAGQGQGGPAAQGGQRGGGQPQAPAPPTPRLADGKTNFGRVPGEKGVWGLPYITNMGARNIVVGAPPADPNAPRGGGGMRGGAASEPWVPFQPWAAAVYNYHSKNESKYDPEGYCLPPGGPRLYATPYPMDMFHLPDRIVQIFEGGAHIWREIYMDGRPHPPKEAIKGQTWIGHSVGRWEDNDTLVVDIVGFNEGTWLDYFGHPHTDDLHVVETWKRTDKNTIRYQALIDDPGAYTAPWTVAWNIPYRPTGELQEYICQENNKYLTDLKDDFGQPILTETPVEGRH